MQSQRATSRHARVMSRGRHRAAAACDRFATRAGYPSRSMGHPSHASVAVPHVSVAVPHVGCSAARIGCSAARIGCSAARISCRCRVSVAVPRVGCRCRTPVAVPRVSCRCHASVVVTCSARQLRTRARVCEPTVWLPVCRTGASGSCGSSLRCPAPGG